MGENLSSLSPPNTLSPLSHYALKQRKTALALRCLRSISSPSRHRARMDFRSLRPHLRPWIKVQKAEEASSAPFFCPFRGGTLFSSFPSSKIHNSGRRHHRRTAPGNERHSRPLGARVQTRTRKPKTEKARRNGWKSPYVKEDERQKKRRTDTWTRERPNLSNNEEEGTAAWTTGIKARG